MVVVSFSNSEYCKNPIHKNKKNLQKTHICLNQNCRFNKCLICPVCVEK